MGGFIGLDELFRKLEIGLKIKLSAVEKTHIRKILYPLSLRNPYTLSRDDFKKAMELLQTHAQTQEVKEFLISYLEKNILQML